MTNHEKAKVYSPQAKAVSLMIKGSFVQQSAIDGLQGFEGISNCKSQTSKRAGLQTCHVPTNRRRGRAFLSCRIELNSKLLYVGSTHFPRQHIRLIMRLELGK